jgi:hypothetical protein
MGLQKGCKANNKTGRPVGAVGKANQDIKQWIKSLLEANQAQFTADLMEVEPMQRLQVMTSLLRFAVPTLSSISSVDLIQTEYLELQKLLDNLSPAAIDLLSEKILQLSENTNS